MDFRDEFKDSTIVITGACGVFGRWIATAFAQRGARLCLSDNRADALDALAADLGATGPRHIHHVTELTDEASIADLVSTVGAEWGAPDVVINNAGIYPSGFLLDIDAAEWDRIMDVNVNSAFAVTKAALPHLERSDDDPSVTNVSSILAHTGAPIECHYAASKGALLSLTRSHAGDFAPDVRVNAVAPGHVETDMTDDRTPEEKREELAQIPVDRYGQPEDIADAAAYLRDATFVTGETLNVNGGELMR
jgi:3-oxoacyl-[acyl-carrier protein] reductase